MASEQYKKLMSLMPGGNVDHMDPVETVRSKMHAIHPTSASPGTWVEAIEDVDLDDLNPESLWKFRVRGFGPLLVAMDTHGGSLYSRVREASQGRRAEVLKRLGVR